jgi:endoglucanase
MALRQYLLAVLFLTLLTPGCTREDEPLVFTSIDLFKFSQDHKGFNLLGKYDVGWSNNGYTEEEFIIVNDLGFNFVRLPLDYRTYTQPGNWDVFPEEEIAEIDKALEFGEKYGVHVCINLHRAPGYCVNPATNLPASQNVSLWSDASAQKAFVKHWDFFATRYKDIPWSRLSFNLINEPSNVEESTYITVMKKAIDRIQSINPDRIIFVDGLNYARDIMLSLRGEPNIIQAIHVYDPFTLTHYKAGWVSGSDSWPLPVWTMTDINMYLYGPWKSEYRSSLILEGSFPTNMEVIINVNQVSIQSNLEIKWNMIGTMGIINSERADCSYEPYRGKSIDREMTTIIQSTGR